jgi:rRNA maturation endonuclease Nob1
MIMRISRCVDCGYEAITWDGDLCRKCGGKLEIIASEDKEAYEEYERSKKV